jgi:transposase-like protein
MPPGRSPRRPPHCPNPDCDSHANPNTWRFIKKGFFSRDRSPRRIQRYRCQHCRRYFSSQTFSTTYWLKRPDLLRRVFWGSINCAGLRQMARETGVAHATIQHLLEHLGRHCLLLHERLRPRTAPREPLVLDGFRTFEFGHYWPFDLNLLVGTSHFVYGFNDAELRRSGTHTPRQKVRRRDFEAVHGRPDPQATRRAVTELVGRAVPEGASVELHSDEHTQYPKGLQQLPGRTIDHRTTSSKASRTPRNPLFPVNLADLLLRHGGANHKRETIAFSKRRQGALYRAAIWQVWRNYMKSRSERRRDDPPGVAIGVIAKRFTVEEVLRQRLFPWQAGLSGWLAECYFGRIPTRRLARCRHHDLSYAR